MMSLCRMKSRVGQDFGTDVPIIRSLDFDFFFFLNCAKKKKISEIDRQAKRPKKNLGFRNSDYFPAFKNRKIKHEIVLTKNLLPEPSMQF